MKRKVFFSFHYRADAWRASQIRNMGAVEGDQIVSDNDWEEVKRGGDAAIQRWIDGQLSSRSCTIVLIGAETAGRKWIDYEIKKSWELGKGLVGIYIHNLENSQKSRSQKGKNPFDNLSGVVKTYDPPYFNSKDVYNYIKNNLEGWIEEAIAIGIALYR
jgi:hypothetical protein